MGNVLVPMASMIVPMIGPLVGLALSFIFRRPNRENPTMTDIQARHQAEQAQRKAEQAAKEAQELAQETQRRADEDREQARVRQEEADRAAARAAEEAVRLRAQMEEAASTARHVQERAEAAANTAREEAAKLAREAQEERARAQKMREDAEKALAVAKEEADRAQNVADEQRREAEAGRALAEEMARTAVEETQKAKEAKEDAERRLKEGIQPVVTPSPEELAAAKRRIQYKKDCFHFAIAGISGSGKSSLVNAFRGLRSQDVGSAAVGVTETTLQMTRYPDANPENPFVWYDIPGAGTIKCRDWQYFNDQGLYVFDFIIVLFDNRFTMTDIAILVNARRFNIPAYIVRSKADQHILNIMKEKGYDSDDEENVEHRNKLYKAARKQFVEETRKSVRANLEDANLPDQRVYIVSNAMMLSIVLNKVPKKTIDEVDLLNDLLNQAYSRRVTRSDEMVSTRVDSGSRR
jgi:GTP-binding protein EngB required for normal cell division